MSLVYYRGSSFIKDYFCRYLTGIFLANEKGILDFYDGTRQLKFSSLPTVIKKGAWDQRKLPVVIVGSTRGKMEARSFSKDLVHDPKDTETEQVVVSGGDFSLSVEITIMATTIEERDRLTDIVSIYLSHPDAKDFFLKQSIRLPTGTTFADGGEIARPGIDHPIYRNTLAMDALGAWRDEIPVGLRLIDIVTDITAFMDPFDVGREDVIP